MPRFVSWNFALICLGFAANSDAAILRLAWDANPETDVVGYRLLYGTSSRNYTVTVDVGNRTTFALLGLADGRRYYLALQAYNRSGVSSPLSAEVSGVARLDTSAAAANILLGQGPSSAGGGRFAIHTGFEQSFSPNAFSRLPWPEYNATGGGVRVATGDVDGDGRDEVVVGLGRGGNGWIAVLDDATRYYALLQWVRVAWPEYAAANGEVFPAVGNIDGDSRAEIVLGLGNGGHGWYEILDDASQDFRHLAWRQVSWPAYNAGQGPTHPAVGDVNGDGSGEIIVGLGRGAGGWVEVVNGAASRFSSRRWIRTDWSAYASSNGATYPAAGDLDGDGRAEIVLGLGAGSSGWFDILDDAQASHRHLSWQRGSWSTYNAYSGELHPAVGNVDGDSAAEIVLGLSEFPGNGGWFEVRDDSTRGYRSVAWRNIGWAAFAAEGGALFPAVSDR